MGYGLGAYAPLGCGVWAIVKKSPSLAKQGPLKAQRPQKRAKRESQKMLAFSMTECSRGRQRRQSEFTSDLIAQAKRPHRSFSSVPIAQSEARTEAQRADLIPLIPIT